MKIAFGVICRDFNTISPYEDFLLNAQRHKIKIDSLIVVYEDVIDHEVVDHLSQYTQVLPYRTGNNSVIHQKLQNLRMSPEDIENILMNDFFDRYDCLPYGAHRNQVLVAALLKGVDYLLFFDTDTEPRVLLNHSNQFEEVNWVKRHMQFLRKKNVVATSSEYTGYFIVPPIHDFEALDDLLFCVQKNPDYYYKLLKTDCLVAGDNSSKPVPTMKLLGGNLGFSLKELPQVPPFHSTYFILDNEFILSRGEDTLMGAAIYHHKTLAAIDIQTHVFHDTFGDYPKLPNLNVQENVRRFYKACVGWIGRNPIYNWYFHTLNITKESAAEIYEKQKRKIDDVAKKAADFFKYEKFLHLPLALEQSYAMLNENILNLKNVDRSWKEFLKRVPV